MSEPRLKQVEILLESCAKVAVNNQKDIRSLITQTAQNQTDIRSLIEQTAQNQTEIREVRQQVASLSDMFVESVGIMRVMQSDIKIMQSDIKTMQSEIKGLQTENKRILDHLFGENPN